MENMPVMSDILKKKYCLGEPEKCARYQVARKLGRGNVPSDLFPSHHDRAEDLISEKMEVPKEEPPSQ